MDVAMTYLNKKVNIIVELMTDDQMDPTSFSDCFNAVNVFIQVTYELINELPQYGMITVSKNAQRGYFRFRSTSRHTSRELTQLLRLRRYLRCEVGNGGNALIGALRPLNQNDGVEARRYKLEFKSLTSKYEPTRNRISPPCQNVSIGILTGSTERKDVDLKCLDESTLKNGADLGKNEACAMVKKFLVAVLLCMTFRFS